MNNPLKSQIAANRERFEKECNHWTCNGCDKCGGWAKNPDVEKACINLSCDCHSKCKCILECDGECHSQEPYGFVPHAGCPKHDSMSESERIQAGKIKGLFDMVYGWGRTGVVADFESNAFRKSLTEICNNAATASQTSLLQTAIAAVELCPTKDDIIKLLKDAIQGL